MVSVSVFSLIMVMCMGAILSILSSNYKSQTQRSIIDNLNTTLESMTRTIRFGTNYHCSTSGDISQPQDCAGDSSLALTDSNGYQVIYSLSGASITRSVNGGTSFLLTSPDVIIQSLTFQVYGSSPYPDLLQPKVIIIIKGYVNGKDSTGSAFTLETTVSQRKFDL